MTKISLDRPSAEQVFQVGKLWVEVYSNRGLMGQAAALDVAVGMRDRLRIKDSLSMIFAAAPSQNEFLATLSILDGLEWNRVIAFHMDEYVGLPTDAPQLFARFLRDRLFDCVQPGTVHYLDGSESDLGEVCDRYARLLDEYPPDIVCLGIGENGHIAFNDPGVADFDDPRPVKLVDLDDRCRLQQVHDGCFPDIDAVPKQALTMTVPTLMSGAQLHCVVPGPTKAEAVKKTLQGPISESCPASILRRHDQAILYLDTASARLL